MTVVRRTFDAAFLNRIANDPSVRPFLGGEGPIEAGGIVGNPDNVALATEHGAWVFMPLYPGAYEVHTMVLPEGRGRPHIAAAREGLRYMFARTDCVEILTKCPDDNGPARWASSVLGFRERFHRDDAWAPGVGVSFRALTADDWFVRDAVCLQEGRALHDLMEAAKRPGAAGHPPDEMHDRAAGAASLMVRAGQAAKGVGFYNRWARFAGYPPIAALSPSVVDAGGGFIIEHVDGALEVLSAGVSLT